MTFKIATSYETMTAFFPSVFEIGLLWFGIGV
jgi:hypothetical protein